MNIKKISFFCLLSIAQSNVQATEPLSRWYSPSQQAQGAIIFKNNCATCHGDKAQATYNWKQTYANGQYPPPPLNGNAHAWHHNLDALRLSIRDGGLKIGGLMPSFEQTLSAKERDNAIAFFQSQWSEELYTKWSKNFKVPPLKEVSYQSTPNPVLKRLMKRLNTPKIDAIEIMANQQLYQVLVNEQTIYLTKDGRFALIGKLIDLETGKQLSP